MTTKILRITHVVFVAADQLAIDADASLAAATAKTARLPIAA